jgi:hypothetical protein
MFGGRIKMGTKMKTKEEILKMSKKQLESYKWSDDLKKTDDNVCCDSCNSCDNCSDCFDCFDCFNCSNCSDCFDCYSCDSCDNCYSCDSCDNCSYCFDCLFCRNLKSKRFGYYICNVEVTKEEFDKKMEELKQERS